MMSKVVVTMSLVWVCLLIARGEDKQMHVYTVTNAGMYGLFAIQNAASNDLIEVSLSVDVVVKQLRKQGDMTNLVNKLVASGDVCAVVGHMWNTLPHTTLEYSLSGQYTEHRQCRLCGKVETKQPGEWK